MAQSNPYDIQASQNPEMSAQISRSNIFSAIAANLEHENIAQAMHHLYSYPLEVPGIVGQSTVAAFINIEQGTDFKCMQIFGSAFSYDAGHPTLFPVPGATDFAARGLSIKITDSRTGRELIGDFCPVESLLTPGYGINWQTPLDFKYLFPANTKIVVTIKNRDSSSRTHDLSLVLKGFKIATTSVG